MVHFLPMTVHIPGTHLSLFFVVVYGKSVLMTNSFSLCMQQGNKYIRIKKHNTVLLSYSIHDRQKYSSCNVYRLGLVS